MSMQGETVNDSTEELELHGLKGISICLRESMDNKPRITKNQNIVNGIVKRVQKLVNSMQPFFRQCLIIAAVYKCSLLFVSFYENYRLCETCYDYT